MLDKKKNYDVKVDYVTPRGEWYLRSWKGDEQKSGGLATNIGCHLFDLLYWFFGHCERIEVQHRGLDVVAGSLTFSRAYVDWRISIRQNETPIRRFRFSHKDLELSDGFNNLHTKAYEGILAGRGFGIEDTRESIQICEKIRQCQ